MKTKAHVLMIVENYFVAPCCSLKISLDEVDGPSKIKSCEYTCVGVWTTTTSVTTPTSPSTSFSTNRTATPTRSPPSRASGNTLKTSKSTSEGSSTVSSNSSSNVENVAGPNDTNYAVVIGVPIVCFVLLLACIAGVIVIYKRVVKSKENGNGQLEIQR